MASDKATNARLLRTYGITLADYDRMLAEQGSGCAICGRPPGDKRLHVDHDHSVHKVKIYADKYDKGWRAYATYRGLIHVAWETKKSTVVKALKQKLKSSSVRGLLDWKCNAGLQKWRDNPDLMEKAAQYLRKFQETV